MIVLGLDVSTNTVGYCFMKHESKDYGYIMDPIGIGFISLGKYKKDWYKKADITIAELIKQFEKLGMPDVIQIENNLLGFQSGRTSMNVITTLARFNGIVSWGVYRATKIKPVHLHPSSARKKAWGTTFHYLKGINKKIGVLGEVLNKWPTLEEQLPRRPKTGDYKNEVYDIADAITMAAVIPERDTDD